MVENPTQVVALANRLRRIQEQFADSGPAERHQFLTDEIAAELEGVAPPERQAFLEALLARFPTWDPMVRVAAAEVPAPARSQRDERELRDPGFLVGQLIEALPSLSDAEKQAVAGRLQEAGLALTEPWAWPDWLEQLLRSKLMEGGGAPVDPARVVQGFISLLDFVCILEPVVWKTWQAVTARTDVKSSVRVPPGSLRNTFTHFLREDDEFPPGRPKEELETFRKVVSALVIAIAHGGRQFGCRYVNELSPRAIATIVETEGTPSPWRKDKLCWRKYLEVTGDLDEHAIEDDVLASIAGYAVRLIEGLGQ